MATGWNGDHLLESILKQHGANYVHEFVVIGGKLITGNGPDAAEEFGKMIVKLLL